MPPTSVAHHTFPLLCNLSRLSLTFQLVLPSPLPAEPKTVPEVKNMYGKGESGLCDAICMLELPKKENLLYIHSNRTWFVINNLCRMIHVLCTTQTLAFNGSLHINYIKSISVRYALKAQSLIADIMPNFRLLKYKFVSVKVNTCKFYVCYSLGLKINNLVFKTVKINSYITHGFFVSSQVQ